MSEKRQVKPEGGRVVGSAERPFIGSKISAEQLREVAQHAREARQPAVRSTGGNVRLIMVQRGK